MLALATPAIHDHPSHSVPGPTTKTPILRSKLNTRRAPSLSSTTTTSISVSSSALPSSSSSSSSSSAPTVVPPTALRTTFSASQPVLVSASSSQSTNHSAHPSSRATSQRAQSSSTPAESKNGANYEPLLASPAPSQPPNGPVPVDIHSYPTSDLLKLLASLLTQIATANDGLSCSISDNPSETLSRPNGARPPIWQTLFSASKTSLSTPTSPLTFHARNIPSISLEAYLFRILRYCPTTNEVFLSLLVYFDRMSKLAQESNGTRFMIDSYNVHRLVIAGVTVASKFFSDVFYTNSRYAKVGGLPQAELNQLELQFLLLNDFRLSIPTDEMQRYADQLIRFSQTRGSGVANGQLWQSPQMTESRTLAASMPLQSMGAFDAFGGSIAGADAVSVDGEVPRNSTPRRSTSTSAVAMSSAAASITATANGMGAVPVPIPIVDHEERDQESSVYSDTEAETSTDDEPTIRASHSCASSDTQSLFSNDASEDGHSSFDMHGNEEDDEGGPPTDDEDPAGILARATGFVRQPVHYRWNSSASSVDDHAS